jgi:hypothetical protein
MKITKEFIDMVTPEHGRASCSDDSPTNGLYDISEESIKGVVVKRYFKREPRCNRCFLLDYLDREVDPRIVVHPELRLSVKEPKFSIQGEEDQTGKVTPNTVILKG